ncbi:MAG: GNAT family N-acetyltransferase [Trueperaceae bacterium]
MTDRGAYLLIRTPSNPNYHWGNMLMFPGPPGPGDYERWEELFRSELGNPPHRVYGWDKEREVAGGGCGGEASGPAPVGAIEPFLAAGFRVEQTVVLTATEVHDPPSINREAVVRPLKSDADWQAALELGVLCRDFRYGEEGYRTYLAPKMKTYRRMQDAGLGSWFGAFWGEKLVADMGVFAEAGIARFQSVKTHPDFRRRGICGTSVAEVARYALGELGASQLVMLADPGYQAARIYESVGFVPRERVAGVARP